MNPILFQINKKPKSSGKPGIPKIPTNNAIITKNGIEEILIILEIQKKRMIQTWL